MSNDAYGHTVSMATDGTTDIYLVGGSIEYSFPAGTSQNVAYLSLAINANLLLAKAAAQDYIQSRYSRDAQIQLLVLYLAAQRGGLTNRANYIAQLLTWLNSIIAVLGAYVAQVQALTDPAVVAATTIDMSQFPTDPSVTMLGAVTINS